MQLLWERPPRQAALGVTPDRTPDTPFLWPRPLRFLGIVASVMNCYMLFPAMPKPAVQAPAVKPPPKIA